MKKMLISLIFAPMLSFAATVQDAYENPQGIVTPNMATDGVRLTTVGRTMDGELVVCPRYKDLTLNYNGNNGKCLDKNDKSAWVKPEQTPPKGKTYVGFKIVSGQYGTVEYEFYWK